jgi:hypothetical protein
LINIASDKLFGLVDIGHRRLYGNKMVDMEVKPRTASSALVSLALHNEELNDLYSLPNIVRVVKSRRMRWEGHVARMGRREVCTGCWWGNQRERGHWGYSDVDGRIILRWILRKLEWGWGLDRVGSG